MRPRSTTLAVVLLFGCSDSTAPGPGTFRATVSGARSGTLSGESNGSPFFTVEYPDARFAMRMFDVQGDHVRAVVLHCPGENPPAPGSYAVGTDAADCAGNYSLVETIPGGGNVLELATALSGQLTISSLDGNELAGSFSFQGPLVVGSEAGGTLHASGTFSSTLQP